MPPLDGGRDAQAPRARSQAALHPAAAALHRGLAGQDCWRSAGSGGRRPTPRSSAPSRTAATCGASAARCSRPSSACRSPTCWCPHFPEVMDVEFTAQLEESLDKIEEGDADWVKTVETFYKQFSRDLKAAGKKMDNVKVGRGRRRGVPRVRQAAAREVGALREVPGVLRLPGLQVHQGHERRARAAGRRADRRDLPDVQQADGHQARPLRQVHRVLGLSGVQDHQAGDARDHVPAARTAAASSSRSAPARARPSTRARTTPRASSRSGRARWPSRARSARPRS